MFNENDWSGSGGAVFDANGINELARRYHWTHLEWLKQLGLKETAAIAYGAYGQYGFV